ncbi:MAG: hypothetical protein GY705_02920 [Bacteroidetes bacterium]|nr:hypothetical protein [Bacteroidota bacterium]
MNFEEKKKQVLSEYKSLLLAQDHLKDLENRLKEAYAELEKMEKTLDKEYADVEKLEKFSINSLFKKVLGNKEEQLEIERHEYLQAVLKQKEVTKSVELLEFEQKVIEEKLNKLPKIEKELERLLQMQEKELLSRDPKSRLQLKSIIDELDNYVQLKREIYEAKIVGAKAKQLLEKMIVNLRQAYRLEEWNSHYQFPGKGKPYVQKAQRIFYEAKQTLYTFEKELKDIYRQKRVRLTQGIENLNNLSRIYYDNLISDWVVHNRIQNAHTHMEAFHDRVVRILQTLNIEEQKVDKQIISLEEKKREIIMNSL